MSTPIILRIAEPVDATPPAPKPTHHLDNLEAVRDALIDSAYGKITALMRARFTDPTLTPLARAIHSATLVEGAEAKHRSLGSALFEARMQHKSIVARRALHDIGITLAKAMAYNAVVLDNTQD